VIGEVKVLTLTPTTAWYNFYRRLSSIVLILADPPLLLHDILFPFFYQANLLVVLISARELMRLKKFDNLTAGSLEKSDGRVKGTQ
jgi:hypothetical protein